MPIDQRAIASMRDAFLAFRREMQSEAAPPDIVSFPSDEWSLFAAGSYQFIYQRPETTAALDKLRAKFERKEWTSKWSEKRIQEIMSDAIGRAMADPDPEAVLRVMTDAAAELDASPPKQRIIVAIRGVRMLQEVHFGVVRLFQMTDAEFEQLTRTFVSLIDSSTGRTVEQKEELKARVMSELEPLRNSACMDVQVNGDVERAKEDAAAESEPVIDLLQVVAAIEEPSVKRIHVAPGGAAGLLPPPRVVLSEDGTEAHFDKELISGFRLGVDQATIERLRMRGFGAILDALGKPSAQRSEFEAMLLNAVHWIADAERQAQPENRITSYMTALDMFFSNERGPIVRDVSEGVAYVLDGDLPTRKKIRDLVSKLYGRRSKVSHEGQRSTAETEVTELKVLVINAVARMSRLAWRFSTKDDVAAWLLDLRLTGTYDEDPPGATAENGGGGAESQD